jgi:hypothetical protein
LIIICCVFLFKIRSRKNQIKTAQVQSGILVPSSTPQRFGIYNWNIDSPFCALPCDLLNYGAARVEATGSRTIRIYLGPSQATSYRLDLSVAATLVQIANHPSYHTLFTNPSFDIYLLTAYSKFDNANNWADGFTAAEYEAERAEIRGLCDYLLNEAAFAGKTFIILNWEGDNAIAPVRNKRIAWDAYKNWIQSRADGVALARMDYPGSTIKLFSGLEFNEVEMNGRNCGTSLAQTGEDPATTDPYKYRCVIDYVAPKVSVDYYSYSSWSSLGSKYGNPAANLKILLKNALDSALKEVRALRPAVDQRNFIIGEFGFPRELYGECNAANYINEIFDAVNPLDPEAFHPSIIVLWQILDNSPSYNSNWRGFGLYKVRDGLLLQTRAFTTFQRRIDNQSATIYANCLAIRTSPPESVPGVVDSSQVEGPIKPFRLNPDNIISIYIPNCCQIPAQPFSTSGNSIHLDQGVRRLTGRILFQSSSRINASLNPALRPGQAFVYVSDANELDSNGLLVDLTCSTCPTISSIEGEPYKLREYYPGSEVTINGQLFSVTGNSVTIEQVDDQNITKSYVLKLTSQTQNQIKAILPAKLLTNRNTLLYVTNSRKVRSNDMSIYISQNCQLRPCSFPPPPVIRPNNGISNSVTETMVFHPNDAADIYGARFSDKGNKVILEQYADSSGKILVRTHTIMGGSTLTESWREGNNRINFKLPPELSPGRAIIYVVDAQGRETMAQEIMVSSMQ